MTKSLKSRGASARRRAAVLLGTALLACPVVSRANTTYTWNGATVSGLGLFSEADNWTPTGAPPTNGGTTSDLVFGSLNAHAFTPSINTAYSVNSLTFNSSALAFSLLSFDGNYALTVGAGGINDSATTAQAVQLSVALSASQNWNVVNNGVLTVTGGSLTNSSSSTLTRTGAGTLNLALSGSSGISAMSLTGGTTQISSGTLALNTSGNPLTISGAFLNLSGGAVVNTNANGFVSAIIDAGSVANVSGSGTALNALGGNAEIDVARSTSGTLNVSGSGSVSSADYLVVGGFNATNSGTLNISSGATVTAPLPLIGFKPGSTGTVLVSGSGSTLNATSNLEMSGNTIGGTYGGTSNLTVSNSAVVNAAVTTFYSNNSTIDISGGTLNTGGLNSNASGNGAILLIDTSSGAGLNLNGASGSYIYSGSIGGGGGTINKTNGATQTLAGSLSCGSVQVNGGTLNLQPTSSTSNIITQLSVNSGFSQLTSGYLSVGSGSAYATLEFNGTSFNVSGTGTLNLNATAFVPTIDDGTLNVTGSGATVQVASTGGLSIGTFDPGTVNVMQGGYLNATGDAILIGNNADATLNVQGGTVVAEMVNLAGSAGTGVVNIGASSSFTAGSLDLGGFGLGSTQIGGTGIITLTNGGILITTGVTSFDSPSSYINVSGGVMTTGALSSMQSGFGLIELQNSDAAHVLTINGASGTNTYSGSITGIGGLNKSGGSTQILSGALSIGKTTVSGGTLNFVMSNSTSNTISALSVTGGVALLNAGQLAVTTNSGNAVSVVGGTFNVASDAICNVTQGGGGAAFIDSGGLIYVSGNGTQLNCLGSGAEISVGGSAAGTLNVQFEGNVSSGGLITVAGDTTGLLTIGNGGIVSAPYPNFGRLPGSTGTANISGSGSVLNATTDLELGGDSVYSAYGGSAIVNVSSGGAIKAATTTFFSNTASINISGGTLITGGLNSNASGNGAITLTDPTGGYALSINGSSGTSNYSGTFAGTGSLLKTGGSTQILSLAGASALGGLSLHGGTTQLSSGTLTLSNSFGVSAATFNISNGAILNSAFPSIQAIDNGGSMTVTGSGSKWVGGGQVEVGAGAVGSMTVTSGGFASAGSFLVLGAGGSGVNGTLTISSGGTVTAPIPIVGLFAGSVGMMSVSGAGSSLNATAFLAIGGDNGFLPNSTGGTGAVTITNSGAVNTPLIDFESSTSSANISGGTLNSGALTSLNTGFGAISLTNPTGGYALNINGSSGTNTYSGTISGTGSLNKSGGSTQTLSGNNTFTGTVLVTGGTLILNGTNKFTFANVSGGTLSMGTTGALAAGTNITVGSGAFFAPGSASGNGSIAIGTLTLNGGTYRDSNMADFFDVNQIVTGSTGGTLDFTGSSSSFIALTGTSAGIIINGNSTWLSPNNGANIAGGGTINISSGVTLTNGVALAVDASFNIIGGGTLYQDSDAHNAGFIGASITVTQGEFRLSDASSNLGLYGNLGNFGAGTFTLNGGSLSYGGVTATTIKPINITASGGTIQIESADAVLTDTGGIISSGGLIKTGPGELIVPAFSISNLTINNGTLGLSGSGRLLKISSTLTVGAFTTLDLGSNAADISSGDLAAMNLLVQQGYNAGQWNGSGVTSSTAAADAQHLTAVGVIQNNQGGTAIFNSSHPFLNTTPGASDILLAYTYYGDTNLNGIVDGTDYSRVDTAYLADRVNHSAYTGWFNGDFNYDGTVNGSDYTLMDNAFNTQGAQLTGEVATPTAQLTGAAVAPVPEPAELGLLVAGTLGLVKRRMRRHP